MPEKKTRFCYAEEKTQNIKAGYGFYRYHARRDESPTDHDTCQPDTWAYFLQNDIRGYISKEITNKKTYLHRYQIRLRKIPGLDSW
ncbi:hypothetical protein OS31_30140 [Dickeya oryzae]